MSHAVYTVGTLLENRRKALGLSIQDVSQAIKVRPKYLLALERGEAESLMTVATYNIGYIRIYAHFLGLNGEMLISRLREINSGLHVGSDLHVPECYRDDNQPGMFLLAVCIMLVLLLYGAWYYQREQHYRYLSEVSDVAEKLRDFAFISSFLPPSPRSLTPSQEGDYAIPPLLVTDIYKGTVLSLFAYRNSRIVVYHRNGEVTTHYIRQEEWLFLASDVIAISGDKNNIDVHTLQH